MSPQGATLGRMGEGGRFEFRGRVRGHTMDGRAVGAAAGSAARGVMSQFVVVPNHTRRPPRVPGLDQNPLGRSGQPAVRGCCTAGWPRARDTGGDGDGQGVGRGRVPRPMTGLVWAWPRGLLDNQHAVPLSCRARKIRRAVGVERETRTATKEKLQQERRRHWLPLPISGLDTPAATG